MLRSMRLRRIGPGEWQSRDGRWQFEFWDAAQTWFVREWDAESGDWFEYPATGDRFRTLWEATDWASKQKSDEQRP